MRTGNFVRKKRNVRTGHGPVSYFAWLPACSHTFCMLIAELSRARSARTGAPWVRKFAFQAPVVFAAEGEKLNNNKAESFFPLNFNVYIE